MMMSPAYGKVLPLQTLHIPNVLLLMKDIFIAFLLSGLTNLQHILNISIVECKVR